MITTAFIMSIWQDLWSRDFFHLLHWLIYMLPFTGKWHTLLEQFCPKNQFSEKNDKIVNLNFCAKNQWISVIFKHWFLLEFEFSRQKSFLSNKKIKKKCWILTIFGTKIQIHNFDIFLKIEFLDKIWYFLTVWICNADIEIPVCSLFCCIEV